MSQAAHPSAPPHHPHRLPTIIKAGVVMNLTLCLAILLGTPHLEAYWSDVDLDLPAPTAFIIEHTWIVALLPICGSILSLYLYTCATNQRQREIAQAFAALIVIALCLFLTFAALLPEVTITRTISP